MPFTRDMEWVRGRKAWVWIFVALMGTSACSKPKVPLRIGLNAWPGYEFLYLAEVQHFYQARGVTVQLVEFGSLSDARLALERDQIDGLGTTMVEVLLTRSNHSTRAKAVRVVDYSAGADVVLAADPVTSVQGLAGKRVGVELGSLGVYVLAASLAKANLKLSDVDLVSEDQSTMVNALLERRLDAIVTYPPESLRALAAPGIRMLFSTKEIPKEVVDVIAFSEEVLRQRRADVTAVLDAFDDASSFASKNPAEAYPIMAKREGISAEEFRTALTDGIRVVSQNEQEEYFKVGGHLDVTAQRTEQVLRATSQLKAPLQEGLSYEWVKPGG